MSEDTGDSASSDGNSSEVDPTPLLNSSVGGQTYAPTTDAEIAQQGMLPANLYESRAGIFLSAVMTTPPPYARESRHPFVLTSYLKSTTGASVYQPTGYAVNKALSGNEQLSQEQFIADNTTPIGGDPVDDSFSKQGPAVDSNPRDVARPDQAGRLTKETDLRRRAIHVSKGRIDQYDYQ